MKNANAFWKTLGLGLLGLGIYAKGKVNGARTAMNQVNEEHPGTVERVKVFDTTWGKVTVEPYKKED